MILLTVARQLNIVSKISNWRQDTLAMITLTGNANLLIERLDNCLINMTRLDTHQTNAAVHLDCSF